MYYDIINCILTYDVTGFKVYYNRRFLTVLKAVDLRGLKPGKFEES